MLKSASERLRGLSESRVAFTSVKIAIVGFNILQIAFTGWLLFGGLTMISEQEETEDDPKKREMLETNKTVLVISSIMASLLCLTGLMGAIRERYCCFFLIMIFQFSTNMCVSLNYSNGEYSNPFIALYFIKAIRLTWELLSNMIFV